MKRTIFHIDVNSAFLSWEAVKRLHDGETVDIRQIPSAIGGDSQARRGIILAKSTSAKKYGIVTGEPIAFAKRKCPDLVCYPPDFSLYRNSSAKLFNLLQDYSDRIEEYSIDECFLEYTGMEKIFGDPLRAAHHIKDRIQSELGFTVNIGISTNKLLAKMAGELEKPNKVHTLYPHEISEKMWHLPVEELFMVGKRTTPKLKKMGIFTIGDLACYNVTYLYKEFKSFAYLLHSYANGIDDSTLFTHSKNENVKSIGNSTTTPQDITDRDTAHQILLSLSESVATRLRKSNLTSAEIAVSIKTANFKTYSHQKVLFNAIDCTNAIYQQSKIIFNQVWRGEPIRHLGVRAGHLSGQNCIQLTILSKEWEKQRKADEAIDKIRNKFGKDAVIRTTFVNAKPHDRKSLKTNQK